MTVALLSLRGKITEPVRSGHAAIHEEVAAGNERTGRAHEKSANGCDFVRSTGVCVMQVSQEDMLSRPYPSGNSLAD
jgi:hypothetical protein